jgi:hypothetical protein
MRDWLAKSVQGVPAMLGFTVSWTDVEQSLRIAALITGLLVSGILPLWDRWRKKREEKP